MPATYRFDPRLIYWLCGAIVLFLFAGWFLSGNRSGDTTEQRLSSGTKLSPSTIPKTVSAPSRMLVGEPLKARLSSQDNAATDWRKAFALADKLTAREKAIINNNRPADPPPTDEEIAALVEKIAPIIALLRAGGAKPECEWGVDLLSLSPNMSHTSQASLLAQIALWDSVQRVETAPQDAVENLMATAYLGNSLQAGLESGYTNAFIHNSIFDFLGTYVNSFSGQNGERMQAMLEGPDLAKALQISLGTEVDRSKYLMQVFLRALQTGQTLDGRPITETDKQDGEKILGSNPSETQLLSYLQEAQNISQQSLYWNDDKFQSWLTGYRRRSPSAGLLGGAVADSSSLMRNKYRVVLAHQQMVRAGWAAMEEGPSAISRLRDPLTGKPFYYREIDDRGSFELRSEVLNNGKPVTMTFQRPGT